MGRGIGFRYEEGQLGASGVALSRVLDAVGSAWVYDAATFDRSGLRLLRMGQRVTVVLDGAQVRRLGFPAE